MSEPSANATIYCARAAFDAAVKNNPSRRWRLKWASYIVEKYDPPGMIINDK